MSELRKQEDPVKKVVIAGGGNIGFRLARALEKAGLVERPIDPADPRAVRLALTERGHQVVAEAIPTVHAKHAELTSAIGGPDGERNETLRELLSALLGADPLQK